MPKMIRVSDSYHEYLKAHNREGETMEETLRRLAGGPDPGAVAGILSEETADDARAALEGKRETELAGKRETRDRFDDE